MVDMESFMKQLETARQQSAKEKEKTDRQKKEAESKDKKFTDAMAKADQLEKEGKFREAWMKVPEITEFPEKADELRRRKKQLSDKFSAPSLFAGVEEEKTETSKEALFPDYAQSVVEEEMPYEEEEQESADKDENEY